MAFDRSHPDRASSALVCHDADNRSSKSFAPVHQSYAQCAPYQWQFLPSSLPSGRLSFPIPAPRSQPESLSASGWRSRHEALVPLRQSPGVDAMSVYPSWAYLSPQNGALLAPNPGGRTAVASYQAPPATEPDQRLLAWNGGLASGTTYQSLMPTALAFPRMPTLPESPAATMASMMLRIGCNAPIRHLGSPPSFPSTQTWSANLGLWRSTTTAPYSPRSFQTPQWQPEFGQVAISQPEKTTSSVPKYPQKHKPTPPLPVVVGHDDPGNPAPTPSRITHAPKGRKCRRPGQVYKIREVPAKRKRDDSDVFEQSKLTLRWKERSNPSQEDADIAIVNRMLGTCTKHRKRHEKCTCWVQYVKPSSPTTLEMVADLLDMRLFRNQPSASHPLATRRTEKLQDILGPIGAPKKILLSQDFSFKRSGLEGLEHGLAIHVVEFKPEKGDKTAHEWYDDAGQSHLLQMPHYCIASVADTWVEMRRYIEAAIPQYLDYIIHNSSQEVTKAMLQRARAFSRNSQFKMVKAALDILAVCRMIEFDWRIVNPDAIGMKPIAEKPWYGMVPPTPIMDTILDQIIIRHYLEPMRERLLSELKRKFYQKAPQNISEIIFTGFILSTNLQLLLKHSRANAVRYHAAGRYNSLDRAREYIKGHNILVAYIQVMLYGSSGSSQSRRSGQLAGISVPTFSQWPSDEAAFFADIQSLLNSIEADLCAMRTDGMYETDLHWSHDLFSRQWTPHSLAIVQVK